jgi:dipeptidyl aminopeptidase/acylaminoacyl peptidase
MRLLRVTLILIVFGVGPANAQTRGLLPTDFYKEATIEDVALRPQGDLIAFTVMTIVEKDNTRHREIWMQALAGGMPTGEPSRFTTPAENSRAPVWSPDGSLLAFTSKRGTDENETWFMRVDAPGGEAFHIDGVEGSPVWSRDGQWVAYLKKPSENDAPADEAKKNEAEDREGWIAPNAVTRTLDAKRFAGRVITSMRYKSNGTLTWLPDPATRRKQQIFVAPASGGEARQVTALPFEPGQLTWLTDNTTIVFAGDPREDDEYSSEPTTELFAVARTGGEPRALTVAGGGKRSPAVSPNGDRLAYLLVERRGSPPELHVVDIRPDGTFASAPRSLTDAWDRDPGMPAWVPDGTAIRFEAESDGNAHVFEVSVERPAVRAVTSGDRYVRSSSTSRDGAWMAYTVDHPGSPTELFVAVNDGTGERQLTRLNDAWLREITVQPARRLTWRVADGTQIEGWLVKPVGHQPGRRYPLVLKIHGGPHTQYGNTWFRTFHVLSNSGFFVLYSNPRGSSGYGHAFHYATRGKWGELDQEDYLAGVDAALAAEPSIDPGRVGVSGGSYGGFMTNWLSARTDRFAAAVTSRSITSWENWYGTSDAQPLTEYEFSGTPWDARAVYRRLSPISYVEQVTIPTLIIHSENDYRTPIADAEQWFMALRKRKVPVEFIRYPRATHDLSRTGEPWLLVDRLERIRSWFDHWLNRPDSDQ